MSRHSGPDIKRLPALLMVPVALIVGGLIDRAGSHSTPSVAATVQPVPIGAPATAYSSSWFCAGATDSAVYGPADGPTGRVVIYNNTAESESARVQVLSDLSAAVTQDMSIPAFSTESVAETVPGGAPWTGALVDVDGSAAVEEVLDGPLGRSIGQCATSGSQEWYLPSGQTRVNASETILLLDPYPTDSIVDLSFTTDQGQEEPQDFEDITVAPGRLVAVDLGSHLRRRSSIATTVTARFGRVVAWSEEIVTPPTSNEPIVGTPAANTPLADPAAAVAGAALSLGAPSVGTTWEWPDGLAGNGVDERYLVYNPGQQTADISLAIGLTEGTAEPVQLSVGPGQLASVVSDQQTRIPAGSPHTAILTSTNGVPVVAARAVDTDDPTAAGGGLVGISVMPGERITSHYWVVPAAATDLAHRGQLVFYNPGSARATVTIGGIGGQASTQTVAGAGRLAVPVGAASAITVRASQPIYVEYDLYTSGSTGYSIGSAIPFA